MCITRAIDFKNSAVKQFILVKMCQMKASERENLK